MLYGMPEEMKPNSNGGGTCSICMALHILDVVDHQPLIRNYAIDGSFPSVCDPNSFGLSFRPYTFLNLYEV